MKSIISVKVMMALKYMYMYVFSLAFLVRTIQQCTLCCCIIHILITDAFDKHLRIKINDKNFE